MVPAVKISCRSGKALRPRNKGTLARAEEGERPQVRTERVEFIALSFPFPSKLKIWSFHAVVVQ